MKTFILLLALSLPAHAKDEEEGRFRLVQLGSSMKTAFLLDSKTGRMWRLACYKASSSDSDCSVEAFEEEIVQGITSEAYTKKKLKALGM